MVQQHQLRNPRSVSAHQQIACVRVHVEKRGLEDHLRKGLHAERGHVTRVDAGGVQRGHVGDLDSVDELHHADAMRGEIAVDAGNVDGGAGGEEGATGLHIGDLRQKVDFLENILAEARNEPLNGRKRNKEYRELEIGEEALDHLRCPLRVGRRWKAHFAVAEVDERVLADGGVLDLDGNLLSGFEVSVMHLCQRRASDRRFVDRCKQLFCFHSEILFDDTGNRGKGHRRGFILRFMPHKRHDLAQRQCVDPLSRNALVQRGNHLTELDVVST